MTLGWLILGGIGIVFLFALLYVVTRMAREREAARRRKQAATMAPLAQDTITYAGHS